MRKTVQARPKKPEEPKERPIIWLDRKANKVIEEPKKKKNIKK